MVVGYDDSGGYCNGAVVVVMAVMMSSGFSFIYFIFTLSGNSLVVSFLSRFSSYCCY